MKTRTDLLNHLAVTFKLDRYLEIGVQNRSINFDRIQCYSKVGVDIDPHANADFTLSSDNFFELLSMYKVGESIQYPKKSPEEQSLSAHFPSNTNISKDKITFHSQFDLIFIDGLHTAEQVRKDFLNAWRLLTVGGFIVLHDCNPEKEEHTIVPRPTERGHWNGDVWRFAIAFTGYESLMRHTVDIDNGCMVMQKHREEFNSVGISDLPWHLFNKGRKRLLNLITWDEFIDSYTHV
jgi:hypothetical protein